MKTRYISFYKPRYFYDGDILVFRFTNKRYFCIALDTEIKGQPNLIKIEPLISTTGIFIHENSRYVDKYYLYKYKITKE